LAVALAGPRDARAELGVVHPDLVRAQAEARAAKGPEVYAALREIWHLWDRADPAQVEEAIASAAQGSGVSPPARVYASFLGAYARRRRGDLDGAIARVARLGFVGRWLTLGPFDDENKQGFPRAFAPEAELDLPAGAVRPGAALDITRLRQDTGFEPEYDTVRAAADYIAWLRVGNER